MKHRYLALMWNPFTHTYMHTALFSHSAVAYLISPLIWERKLQKFTVPWAWWKCNIKACVFYIWQTPKSGPSAPGVHLSEMISLTLITHPCLTASLCVSVGRTVLMSLKMLNCNVKGSTHLSQKRQDKGRDVLGLVRNGFAFTYWAAYPRKDRGEPLLHHTYSTWGMQTGTLRLLWFQNTCWETTEVISSSWPVL